MRLSRTTQPGGEPPGAYRYVHANHGYEPTGRWAKAGDVIRQDENPVLFAGIGQAYNDSSYSTATHFRLPPQSVFVAIPTATLRPAEGTVVLIRLG